MKTSRILGLSLIVLIAACGRPDWSRAGVSHDNENAQQIAKKLKETRKSVVEAETQRRKILASLYHINRRMKKISSDKSRLTNDLLHAQENVKNIAKVIAGLEVQIDRQKIHLRRRLRALYKLSGQGYIAMLFSSQSAVELDESLRFLKIITANDYEMIQSYRENVAAYQMQKERLHAQVEKLVGIEKNIKRQESLLESEHKEKSRIASRLDKKKIESMNRIRNLRDQGKELGNESAINLADLLKPSIYERKGNLAAPVQGAVTQDFGLVIDDIHKTQLNHKGWRYLTAPSAPVAPIFDGVVVYAGFVKGYGNTVILDHGDHYYSIYSHISRLSVKVGDTLKRGDVFAEAGAAMKDHGDGIYFEMRHFSEPENPAHWISKKQIRHASLD